MLLCKPLPQPMQVVCSEHLYVAWLMLIQHQHHKGLVWPVLVGGCPGGQARASLGWFDSSSCLEVTLVQAYRTSMQHQGFAPSNLQLLVLHLSIRFQYFDTIYFDRIIRLYLMIIKYNHIMLLKHCQQIESAVSSFQTFKTVCTNVCFQQKICHCKSKRKNFLFIYQIKHINFYIDHCYQVKYVVMSSA